MTTTLSIPVTRVVVLEDRAQVERSGQVTVPAGERIIELTGISPLTVDRSLKVEVSGVRLVDAKVARRWKAKPRNPSADASDLQRKEHALQTELTTQQHEQQRQRAKQEALSAARGELMRAMGELAAVGTTDVAAWSQQLDALGQRQAQLDDDTRRLSALLEDTERTLDELKVARRLAETPEQELECSIVITVDGSGAATVRATALVPCAVWRPAYRASLQGELVVIEAEAVVWQRTGEVWRDVELSFSTARPTLGTTPPTLSPDVLSTRAKAEVEKRTVEVSIREQAIQTAGESPSSPTAELPGLDDGGEAKLLRAEGRFTVPSDGMPHRLPLSRFETKAQLERVARPELSPLVFTIAKFVNTSAAVLLAGPVQLIRESGYVGRSQLAFCAPQEPMSLSFGSEDGVSVAREVELRTDEARLTGRKTRRTSVTLHVSNASASAQKLTVEERVPVSEVRDVEIALLAKECDPAPSGPDKEGIARFELTLPPNGTRRARFTWELSAAGKVQGL